MEKLSVKAQLRDIRKLVLNPKQETESALLPLNELIQDLTWPKWTNIALNMIKIERNSRKTAHFRVPVYKVTSINESGIFVTNCFY